jgi:hypothetical protein
MPDYDRLSTYIKQMVDQNPDARGVKAYAGTGVMQFRVK